MADPTFDMTCLHCAISRAIWEWHCEHATAAPDGSRDFNPKLVLAKLFEVAGEIVHEGPAPLREQLDRFARERLDHVLTHEKTAAEVVILPTPPASRH